MLFARKSRRIKRLLIVEDEPLVAFDTERYLADEGFGIAATVDTVAEAIALLGSGEVDLVLVVVTLPDGSGIAVDRKRVVWGKSVSVRVELVCRRNIKKKINNNT